MSLSADRAAIAAALSTVPGVTGFNTPPSALQPGNGWARLGGLSEPNNAPGAGPCEVTWRVLVLLAADQEAALDAFEALAVPLWAALQPIGYVQALEPVVYPEPNGPSHNAIQVTMIRELS